MLNRHSPILLVGAGGQVGRRLGSRLAALRDVVPTTRSTLDLEDPAAIRDVVARVRPSLIVNAAAYTAVDAAEGDESRAAAINADAPRILAEAGKAIGAPLIHLSTNYVFDGTAAPPYREGDVVNPINAYGRTKVQGEALVRETAPAHAIIRTAAVYDWTGTNFFRRIRELAGERDELRVVDDQRVAPTPASAVADGVAGIAAAMLRGDGERVNGTWHVTTAGATSWHAFAARLLELDPDRALHRCRLLTPVTTAEYPTPARRPLNGVLDTARFSAWSQVPLPAWDDALRDFIAAGPHAV